MRDPEDLILQSLVQILSVGTNIPSGNIWLHRPAVEFVNRPDGPNVPGSVSPLYQYPAIGINNMKDPKYAINNYGEKINVNNLNGTSTSYEPLGEVTLHLGISLFTQSKKDQRSYGVALYQTLLQNNLNTFINDIIPNEYYNCNLLTRKDVPDTQPMHTIFIVSCQTRILSEITAASVFDLEAYVGMDSTSQSVTGITKNLSYDLYSSGAIWH